MSDDESGFGSSDDEAEAKSKTKPRPDADKGPSNESKGAQAASRRGDYDRRGGMQTSGDQLIKGLKATYKSASPNLSKDEIAIQKLKTKFESMDALRAVDDWVFDESDALDGARLEAAEAIQNKKASGSLDFIRVLPSHLFTAFLRSRGLPIEEYGRGKAKHVRDLWAEVVMRECELEEHEIEDGCTLQRKVKVVAVELQVAIGEECKFLLLKDAWNATSTRKDLNIRVTRKMFAEEDPLSETYRCLYQVLNLSETVCKTHLVIEATEDIEEVKSSEGFPGLITFYNLHVVHMRVIDPSAPALAKLGLPEGKCFTTEVGSTGMGLSTARSCSWEWCSREEFVAALQKSKGEGHNTRGSFDAAGYDGPKEWPVRRPSVF
eukprot:gnl/TRDRNA2_/TRDRNA2_90500_c0_seq2.p1 gnl/TRDRNA2_/TRDRNA2_90500_c0~~gnl/TRDRNA2_/TRDRNA2_90500_c0_seq2.p1  ORF type:complete len:402 (+),score=75.38 gnl/TRDRNA2_/TRDRNA2_90500_c0_seq2:74-1207(+)